MFRGITGGIPTDFFFYLEKFPQKSLEELLEKITQKYSREFAEKNPQEFPDQFPEESQEEFRGEFPEEFLDEFSLIFFKLIKKFLEESKRILKEIKYMRNS